MLLSYCVMTAMRRGALRGSVAAGTLAALLLASCKPIVHTEMFGLSPTSQGAPEIRLAGCPPYAYSVKLTLAAAPDHALWELEPMKNHRPPVLPKRFLIGSIPKGWNEVVSLRRDLAPDVEYEIILSSREAYIVGLDFSLGDLRPGHILDFDGNLVPTARFPLRTTCNEAA
jgi:hypothetical protein